MLRNLFLRKPSLWPRFHVTVAEALEGRKKAEVIELEVPMSDKMKDIQNAVLECVEISISELKKSNSGLDLEDWTVDSALHKNFDVAIRRQLDPMWHRVSFRTRQIVSDLTVLRAILQYGYLFPDRNETIISLSFSFLCLLTFSVPCLHTMLYHS
jgi:DNA excision repair protein ERCC-4